MNFLLDTNVVSEWVKPRPNANVVRWLAETDEDRDFLSVITFAEIRLGVEEMAAGWAHAVAAGRASRKVRRAHSRRRSGCRRGLGDFMARGNKIGLNLSVMDALFAATAGAQAHVGYPEYQALRKAGR